MTKLLEENKVNLWIRQWFLKYDTKRTDEKKKKLDFIKIKNFCASKRKLTE